jgi:hypothetical protein
MKERKHSFIDILYRNMISEYNKYNYMKQIIK